MLATSHRNFQQPSALHRSRTGLKDSCCRRQQQRLQISATLCSTDSNSSSSQQHEENPQTDNTTPYPSSEAEQQRTPQQPPSKTSHPKQYKTTASSDDQNPGEPQPPGSGGPPNNLPPQLQRLLLLLTEFGGIYGTAAVVIAWFTHVDPFGNLHWDVDNVRYGIQTFLPILVLDAVLMLPDYSIGPEDTQEVAGMFFGDPNALRNLSTGSLSVSSDASETAEGVTGDTPASTSEGATSDTKTAAAGDAIRYNNDTTSAAAASGSSSAFLRLRLAMELLQQVYTRANPGIGLSPIAELAVVCVAVLADEMLYRAVGLTLLGLWVRDRLFEAGADETVALNWLGQQVELATPLLAQYGAVALIASLGIGGFAASALREKEMLRRMQVLDADGKTSEKTEDLKVQLMSQIGTQNLVMYGVEGFREVTASIMAGVAFVTTGNLAAPLAGSLAAQTLFSAYQRYTLMRTRKKRKELLDKMKQRSKKLQAAMAAALVTKQTTQQAAATDAQDSSSSSSDHATADEASSSDHTAADSSGSNSENVDFLTLVLQAAEQQEKERKQQQLARSSISSSAAAEGHSTVADWASPAAADDDDNSSNGPSPISSSSTSQDTAAEAEAAKQQLAVLLEDMLRSPEGFKVVKQWMSMEDSSDSSSSISSSGLSKDPRQAVDQLLSDPETKAKLLDELQEQLCAISEAQAQRQKQQDVFKQ